MIQLKKNSPKMKHNVALLILLMAVFAVSMWTYGSNLRSQNPDKILEKGSDFNPPVKIKLVKSKIGEIETDKKFSADDDWFKGLVIRVLNTSDKPVTSIIVDVRFKRPPDQAGELDLVDPLSYGIDPSLPQDHAPSNLPGPILPGQSVDIALADSEYDALRSLLQDQRYPASIKAIRVRIRSVGFSDDTVWTAGVIFKRDPNNPEKWIPVNQPPDKLSNRTSNFLRGPAIGAAEKG